MNGEKKELMPGQSESCLLVAALQAQTEAITRLADSNQQVIDYLLSQEAEDLDADIDGASSRYLDPDED
ncbi:hypothetical protein [Vreelandella nanhaiensis]|uniref:Uncharacterized protein n=1 Tax=Vreelandella nanhaiensis TaxID=1258546 RepID=A0A3S0WCE3_9GAMM|nr:hypothetical protein [Halomonas nanhaiensis]RUR34488.1 hypothetical protein ELY38_02545 [Halomonas nanhaiensis]